MRTPEGSLRATASTAGADGKAAQRAGGSTPTVNLSAGTTKNLNPAFMVGFRCF